MKPVSEINCNLCKVEGFLRISNFIFAFCLPAAETLPNAIHYCSDNAALSSSTSFDATNSRCVYMKQSLHKMAILNVIAFSKWIIFIRNLQFFSMKFINFDCASVAVIANDNLNAYYDIPKAKLYSSRWVCWEPSDSLEENAWKAFSMANKLADSQLENM